LSAFMIVSLCYIIPLMIIISQKTVVYVVFPNMLNT